ncbi:MAG: KH domain-containing protein [Candidatus Woesearchaeota archaeon]
MDQYVDEIKIPQERIAVLIGVKGETKKSIEKEFKVKIKIDSETGDVEISGKDGFKVFVAKNVVHAIGRGFNPSIAMKLKNEDYFFDIIDISDYGNTKNAKFRLKSRVIGTEGKARRNLERLTNTDIEIYGKTIGIIGLSEDVVLAKKAIEMLLEGAKHATVYRYLEKINKRRSFENMLNSLSYTKNFEE